MKAMRQAHAAVFPYTTLFRSCAEATAIGAMIASGDREIAEIVIATEGAELCPPCGRCRQQLAEFAGPGTPVHLCGPDRKSTRLNSSHSQISYAVFCLKKKTND